MRKIIAALAALALMTPVALAVSRDEALEIARDATGGAELVRAERDDGAYEVELLNGNARYRVDVRERDGAVLEVEAEYPGAGWGARFALDEAQAREAAASVAPAAADGYVFASRGEDGSVYEVFYAADGVPGEVTVNAQTGAVVRARTWPAAQGALGVDEVASRVEARKGGARVVELELEWDGGRCLYEGEAEADGARWSFEMDAASGAIIEFERDD